jgi:ATP-dependent Clp protease adapter protein ClpS
MLVIGELKDFGTPQYCKRIRTCCSKFCEWLEVKLLPACFLFLNGETEMPLTIESPGTHVFGEVKLEDMFQLVIWNDDVNSMEHVVGCLMKVFGHTIHLAVKIMKEAHDKGKAVAEVESEHEAKLHKSQLESQGITVTLEKV